ncbi:cAMP-binding domain of CRP or a regulatory subunit of cAMP-dependent protein kinases [Rhizobiales bacterium GAS113]|nr:cAMP-binding domain of CRP or a regulatory subunit of cAMP-dependent protein kinases [Rhizobiales bacterium GAS113]
MDTRPAAGGSRNRLLVALSAADRSLLDPHFKTLPVMQGMVLHEAGEPIEEVYFPHEGMISLLAVMTDGQAIETATVGNEGVVGAMTGFGTRLGFTRAVVQAPVVVSRISSLQFRKAVEASASLRNLMVAYNEVLLAQVQQTAACNALHAVEARLARWLLQTRDRTDSDILPLTQEFLSQMLGVQRTTVTLVARQLERAGVVLHRRGRIEIIDRKGLEEVACECYAIVRAQLVAALPATGA